MGRAEGGRRDWGGTRGKGARIEVELAGWVGAGAQVGGGVGGGHLEVELEGLGGDVAHGEPSQVDDLHRLALGEGPRVKPANTASRLGW